MRAAKSFLLLILALTGVCNAQTPHGAAASPSRNAKATATVSASYYGAVDVGSKGTKGALYSFVSEDEGPNAVVIFSKTINTKLVSSMKDGRFTPEGVADAVIATKKIIATMKAEAQKRNITVDAYYIVGSSGAAKAVNKAVLVKVMKNSTGIDMDFVDAAREGYYGLLSAVPLSRRPVSMYVDVGSGNTKLGCLVGDSDLGNFKNLEIPFGSASTVNEALKRSPLDVNAGIASVMADVNDSYQKQSRDIPCLRNRPRVYWTGGAAWAIATFMHPEKALDGWVLISKRDLDTFLARLKDGTWNAKEFVFSFPKDMSLDRQKAIRAQAEEDRRGKNGVENVFVREQILSGVSIMQTVLNSSNPSVIVRFARSGNFIYGYALDKFKADNPG